MTNIDFFKALVLGLTKECKSWTINHHIRRTTYGSGLNIEIVISGFHINCDEIFLHSGNIICSSILQEAIAQIIKTAEELISYHYYKIKPDLHGLVSLTDREIMIAIKSTELPGTFAPRVISGSIG